MVIIFLLGVRVPSGLSFLSRPWHLASPGSTPTLYEEHEPFTLREGLEPLTGKSSGPTWSVEFLAVSRRLNAAQIRTRSGHDHHQVKEMGVFASRVPFSGIPGIYGSGTYSWVCVYAVAGPRTADSIYPDSDIKVLRQRFQLPRPICFMNSPLSQNRNSSNIMPSLFQ